MKIFLSDLQNTLIYLKVFTITCMCNCFLETVHLKTRQCLTIGGAWHIIQVLSNSINVLNYTLISFDQHVLKSDKEMSVFQLIS